MSEQTIRLVTGRNQQRLELSGICDVALAQELHSAALRAGSLASDVLVDWSAVERLDGGAIQILLALKTAVEQAGKRFQVTTAPESVGEHLRTAGVADRFPAPAPKSRRRKVPRS